ncbi:MAG: hypothetical protein K0R38_1748 [Polyangiaceae bacterium]|nr:hypothetical protein [Polyangiaceae bacterium]
MRGRKVRVTCKHCGYGIIVDGFSLDAPPPAKPAPAPAPAPAMAPMETVPAIFDALSVAEDDATRVMRKPQDFSVHDEPTVVGRIPQEALDAERRFAQSTVPPPKDGAEDAAAPASAEPPATEAPAPTEPARSSPPAAVPHDLPEQPLDSTKAASPHAIATTRTSLPPVPSADVKTLISRTEPPAPALWPWVLGAILIVVVLAALAIRH